MIRSWRSAMTGATALAGLAGCANMDLAGPPIASLPARAAWWDQPEAVRTALPEHIRLSRAEQGCIAFEVTETAPGVFAVSETFADGAALDAHQARTRASAWWQATGHIARDFTLDGE